MRRTVQRIQTEINSGHILLTLSNKMSSSALTFLLRRTVNSRLAYVFVSRNFVHGNRPRHLIGLFRRRFRVPMRRVGTQRQFLGIIGNVASPRRGHGHVNRRFVHIFRRRSDHLNPFSCLTRNALCPSIVRSTSAGMSPGAKRQITIGVGDRRGINKLPGSLRFGLMRPLQGLFGSRIHGINHGVNLPRRVIQQRPFPNPNLTVHVVNRVARRQLRVLHGTSFIIQSRVDGRKVCRSF